jgi:hypothetical protein
MFDAKQVTTIRPLQRPNTRSRCGPTIDFAAERGQPRHVGRRAADRRLVELVVAGEEDGAQRRLERDAARIRDRVREVDALDLERPGVDGVADRQHLEGDVAQLVLVELGARHRDRQLAAVHDRDLLLAEIADHPRQRPEVVLVAVGDDDRLERVDVVAHVAEIGQDQVDAHHLGRREAQAAIDDDHPAVVLDDRHVLSDLADASEREDAEFAAHPAVTPASSPVRASTSWIAVRSVSSHSTSGNRSGPQS